MCYMVAPLKDMCAEYSLSTYFMRIIPQEQGKRIMSEPSVGNPGLRLTYEGRMFNYWTEKMIGNS